MSAAIDHDSVRVVTGDLFESDAQTLVNTVNTVGVMGKGVALQFKRRFPEMYEDYRRRCERGEVVLGQPYLWTGLFPPYVLNFPTKAHWRSVSRLSDITAGLDYLAKRIDSWGITSLAVPPLGCGEGGLEWRVVGPVLFQRLSALPIPTTLFAPFGTPASELRPDYLASAAQHAPGPKVEPAWIALAAILARVGANPHRYAPAIGRTGFQKLSYFATAAGIPTGLDFEKGSYGPHAPRLKQVETRLVNHDILEEQHAGNMIRYHLGRTFEPATRTFQADLDAWRESIASVSRLVELLSARDAEVAATIHFVTAELTSARDERPSEREVAESVLEWKAGRKPAVTAEEVAAGVHRLALLGWIDVRHSPDLPLEDPSEAAF
jgi:O-acetyl-ADP-ribose deacetylase (regulator of RNase III)/uncharacterized protein YwgA